MNTSARTLTFANLAAPTRLDKALRQHIPQWGRRAIQQTITAGQVQVNGRKVWLCSWKVNNGDRVVIANPPPSKPVQPQQFDDSWLIATTAALIAVNKPAGLLSEASRAGKRANLLDLARARFGPVSLAHRLDRDTSGVLLLTRPGSINRYVDAAFKAKTVQKTYLAIIPKTDRLSTTGIIDTRLAPHPQRRDMMAIVKRGGQRAITRYHLGPAIEARQLIFLYPETGRTHQLRSHLAHLNVPIFGDRLYSRGWQTEPRLMLHAYQLDLPVLGSLPAQQFIAPPPAEFRPFLSSTEAN
jgi:23S rRNA pseudouridine1911/1915/1917 synthase